MAKKRKYGSGTVRKRSDGRWEARVVIGYDESGRLISIIYVSDGGTEESHTEFTYNDKGLISTSARYGKDGSLLVFTEYTYE